MREESALECLFQLKQIEFGTSKLVTSSLEQPKRVFWAILPYLPDVWDVTHRAEKPIVTSQREAPLSPEISALEPGDQLFFDLRTDSFFLGGGAKTVS